MAANNFPKVSQLPTQCQISLAHPRGPMTFGRTKNRLSPAAVGCFWQPECRNRAGKGDRAAADSAVSRPEVTPVQKAAVTMGSRIRIRQRKNEGH